MRRRRSCGRGKPAEQFAFARRITERNRSRPLRRRIGAIRLAVHIAERQRELMKLAVGRRAKGRKAAGDRLLQRMRARQRPLVENGQCQPHLPAFVAPFAAHRTRKRPEQRVHTHFGTAWANVQLMDLATRTKVHGLARPPEHEKAIAMGADVAQRLELAAVAAVRCGGEKQHVGGTAGKPGGCSMALAVAGHAVRFVDHDRVPSARQDGAQDLRPLDVIDRRNRNRRRGPRVHADRQRRDPIAHGSGVDDGGVEVEAPRELARPLIAQARRREDEYFLHGAARAELCDGEPRLNRFSQPDSV